MRYKEMPENSLEGLRVRSHVFRIDRWDDYARVGDLSRIASIASDNSDDGGPGLLRVLQRENEIRAHITLQASAANGENEHTIVGIQAATLQPGGENRVPTLVVCSRGQFGDVVCGRISLKAAELPEIIHRVAGISGTAADTEDE